MCNRVMDLQSKSRDNWVGTSLFVIVACQNQYELSVKRMTKIILNKQPL